jgi:hypothetical protein
VTGARLGAVLVVVAAALALRLFGLDTWSLDGDEIYSWFDVQRILAGDEWPHGARSHPLVYLLMAAAASVGGLEEGVLRLLPALCGVGAVLLLLWLRRDVVPAGVALTAGALAASSPWLVYSSQTARFYGPQLLFATLATLAVLPGPRRRPMLVGVAAVLAVLCHPSALFLAPALVLPLLVPSVRWRPLLGLMAGGVAVAAVLVLTDDGALAMVADRVLDGVDPSRYDAAHFVLGLGYNIGPAVGLLALFGLLAARGEGGPDRQLLACAVLPPLLLLGVAASGLSTHQRYATVAVPAVMLLAGHGVIWLGARSRVLGGLALALALAAHLPGLAAQVQDGNRHDLRLLAAVLAERIAPDDIVVADEHAPLWLYLQRHDGLADVDLVEDTLVDDFKRVDFLGNRNQVWVVLKVSRLAGFYDRALMDWIDASFTEVTRVGRSPPPLVRHDNRYVVFRRTRRVLGGRRRPAGGARWA